MNKMTEIAALFNKQLEEEFTFVCNGDTLLNAYTCKFTPQGLYIKDKYTGEWIFDSDYLLHDIITGEGEFVSIGV